MQEVAVSETSVCTRNVNFELIFWLLFVFFLLLDSWFQSANLLLDADTHNQFPKPWSLTNELCLSTNSPSVGSSIACIIYKRTHISTFFFMSEAIIYSFETVLHWAVLSVSHNSLTVDTREPMDNTLCHVHRHVQSKQASCM
jgi:hypothetical protein